MVVANPCIGSAGHCSDRGRKDLLWIRCDAGEGGVEKPAALDASGVAVCREREVIARPRGCQGPAGGAGWHAACAVTGMALPRRLTGGMLATRWGSTPALHAARCSRARLLRKKPDGSRGHISRRASRLALIAMTLAPQGGDQAAYVASLLQEIELNSKATNSLLAAHARERLPHFEKLHYLPDERSSSWLGLPRGRGFFGWYRAVADQHFARRLAGILLPRQSRLAPANGVVAVVVGTTADLRPQRRR